MEDKYGKILVLLLDWAEAFDRIKPDGLLHALRQFGLHPDMLSMIKGICTARKFTVKSGEGKSSQRCQNGLHEGVLCHRTRLSS
eukprot:1649419-Pyramimonas_sp.AAC.1